jgi:hypothetical protein
LEEQNGRDQTGNGNSNRQNIGDLI